MVLFRQFQTIQLSWWCCVFFCSTCLAQQAAALEHQRPHTPQSPPATPADFSHARKLMQQGKLDDATAELEPAAPDTKGLDLELGTAYYKKSDYVKAIEFLKKAVASDPYN